MTLSKFKVNYGRWFKPCNQFDRLLELFFFVSDQREMFSGKRSR